MTLKGGVDLGFRQVKGSINGETFQFDSLVGYPSKIELTSENDDRPLIERLAVTYESETYYVGKRALVDTKNPQLSLRKDKTDDKTDTLKFMATLGHAMGEKDSAEFTIVTGLPVDELGILKEKLETNMKKTFKFKLNGKDKEAVVKALHVIAQSAGAYYDYILDATGNLITVNVKDMIIVIDIGFRTTDVVCMVKGRYDVTRSFTVETGVLNIHQEVRKILLSEYGISKKLPEIDTIVRDGKFNLNNETIHIEKFIKQAAKPVIEEILSELYAYIPNANQADLFLLAGGGATLTQSELESALPAKSQMINAPEFANARGYEKYLIFAEKQKG